MNASHQHTGILRFVTAGNVDDGKSTLIGRLLYESNGIYDDQLDAVAKASQGRGMPLDLSLITDGLRAEREQAITIDVAYRYFSTLKRKFIIADTPGHIEYTRNMVTGASTADAGLLLIDASHGVLEQTRRHAYIMGMLGIRRIILAVNKMDLVGFDQHIFRSIECKCREVLDSVPGIVAHAIPLTALGGDNVVRASKRLDWYQGPTLMELLEQIPNATPDSTLGLRFPVQNVVRDGKGFRGYAGKILSGSIDEGRQVIALPSGRLNRVEKISLYDKQLPSAAVQQSIVLSLAEPMDLGRGDMLVDPERRPMVSALIDADLIWMSERPIELRRPYLIKHTSQLLCCQVVHLKHKVDIETLRQIPSDSLASNDIGRVRIHAHKPLFFDLYSESRATGGFILIDPVDNNTVAAGLIVGAAESRSDGSVSGLLLQGTEQKHNAVAWFTGLSGAGKTTICCGVQTELLARGFQVEILDGDAVRAHLSRDLGFSRSDREENMKRIAFIARLLSRNGIIVLVSTISPYRQVRESIRRELPNFIEIFVNAPLEVCEGRDPKGLYRRARAGELPAFTGIDDPYEPPVAAEVECRTDEETVKASIEKVVNRILTLAN